MSSKIGLLILSTSNKRDNWATIKDSYLFNLTLKTFLLSQDKEHTYIFYIGIDAGDRIFDKASEQEEIKKFSKVFKNVEFKFIRMEGIAKGHVTAMWNRLFKQAYEDKCDYFFQCGDDINFKTKNWINDCIAVLLKNKGVGITGPINNNPRILTQAFVSRRHMEIFGWFFPEQIINWCCDDWYNSVYKPDYFFPLGQHFCSNDGGAERYDIHNNKNFKGKNSQQFQRNVMQLRAETEKIAQVHKTKVAQFLSFATV